MPRPKSLNPEPAFRRLVLPEVVASGDPRFPTTDDLKNHTESQWSQTSRELGPHAHLRRSFSGTQLNQI
jgi:hypothetical protein